MAILSKAQQRVIDAMAQGEELKYGRNSKAAISFGGGRFMEAVTIQTFDFLVRNKMIEESSQSKHSTTYCLTDLGKSKVTPKKN